jgi:DNA topoisomerase-1
MAKTCLVIVESPTKAKTIRKFLPKNFIVEASMGHVRDLPPSAAEIPKDLKKEPWAQIGVNVDQDFEPLYIIPKGKSKIIAELKKKLKEADELYLATDEDREGESISWHLEQVLKPKVPVKRMVFHEITKTAIENALKDVRSIDERLVRAQETRRILDRLYGYSLSPLLWKKIAYGLSAGRVQSVALRLVVDRELDRLKFLKADYWDVSAKVFPKNKTQEAFEAKLFSVGGRRVASGKDFDETTGKLAQGKDVIILDEAKARQLSESLKSASWAVTSVEEKDLTNKPSPPFITSTLQQEGNRKLGLSARDTMRVAQKLYEEGLITYMRTDSPALSTQAISAARNCIEDLFGKDYLSPEPRQFSSKAKGAQEAHEAIRPAGSEFVHPKDTGLSGKELALYELIWKRTVASQMAEAKKKSLSVRIQAGDAIFTASGSRIVFPGFLRAYVEGRDDPDAALEDQEILLPALKSGDALGAKNITPESHETKPPARFTEASLVQTLEKGGVGRPSTYASIISTIVDRGYVRKVGNALVPTFTGFAVISLLRKFFSNLVDMDFTSQMEQSLDEIAEGTRQWLPYLKEFYSSKNGLRAQIEANEKKIDPNESRTVELPHLKANVQVKIGRYGAYIVKVDESSAKEAQKTTGTGKKTKKSPAAEDELHASIPEDLAPSDLTLERIDELLEIQKKGPQPIGTHPESGEKIYCLTGRFGPYVQLGEVTEDKPKPRRASIPKGIDPKSISVDQAVLWLSLPRDLGNHPQTGKPIRANVGRFGPYIMHDGDFRSLKKEDNVYTVTLARALEILAQEKKGRGGSSLVRELGPHPTDQKPVAIYDGKFGQYIKHGSTNASMPKDSKAEDLTMEKALALLAERKAKGKKR